MHSALSSSPEVSLAYGKDLQNISNFVEKQSETIVNWILNILDWRLGCQSVCAILGGIFGWFIGEFEPTFPLMGAVIVLIVSDAWTAYQLDKRVHKKYPSKVKRDEAKFTSFAFGKVIRQTIPKRLWLIILAYVVEHWIFVHVEIPLSYIVAGVIAFEQILSILENEASCREDDSDGRFWKMLKKLLIDKTERHFDVELEELRDEDQKPKRPRRKPKFRPEDDEL